MLSHEEKVASPSPTRVAGIYCSRLRPSVESIVAGAEQHPQKLDSSASSGTTTFRHQTLQFAERIRQLEVQLAISQRCESDSKRQLQQARLELMEMEKRVASKEVANIRRDQSVGALHAMLQDERQRSAANAEETNKMRALMYGERSQHALIVEQQQHRVDALEREVVRLQHAAETSAQTLRAQAEANASLLSDQAEAEAWYRAHRDADDAIAHDAIEQQALACRLQVVAASHSVPLSEGCETLLGGGGGGGWAEGSYMSLGVPATALSTKGLHGGADALHLRSKLADARSEVERLLQATRKQEKALTEVRLQNAAHVVERQRTEEALASAQRQAQEAEACLASCRYELADAKSMAGLLEHRLEEEQARSTQLQDALSARDFVKPSRHSSMQTTINAQQVGAWEADAAMLVEAQSALDTERILQSGRIRAADVRAEAAMEALDATRKELMHVSCSPSLLAEARANAKDAQREVASLRDQVELLQLAAKKQNKTTQLQASELDAARTRLQRMQDLVERSGAAPTGTVSAASKAMAVYRTDEGALLTHQHQQQQHAAAVTALQAQCEALQLKLNTSGEAAASTAAQVASLQETLAATTTLLQETQARNVRLVEQLEDVTLAASRDAAIREAQSRNADVSSETVDAIRATTHHTEMVLRDVAMMLQRSAAQSLPQDRIGLRSTKSPSPAPQEGASASGAASSTVDNVESLSPLEDLAQAARGICAALGCERDQRAAWHQAAAWLLGRHAAVVRWLNAPAVQALLASQHSVGASLAVGGTPADDENVTATKTPDRLRTGHSAPARDSVPRLDAASPRDHYDAHGGTKTAAIDATLKDLFLATSDMEMRGTTEAASTSTPPRGVGASTSSPYTGEASATAVVRAPSAAASPTRVTPSVMASAEAVDAVLEQVLCAIHAQQLDVSYLRKSMYDVKAAFLAEMEAREALEAELQTVAGVHAVAGVVPPPRGSTNAHDGNGEEVAL